MTISGIPDSLLQQINSSATRPGDAVAVTMMRKALDIQASQATQLIQSVSQSTPDPGSRLGSNIDIRA
jgi:hypothetical protein